MKPVSPEPKTESVPEVAPRVRPSRRRWVFVAIGLLVLAGAFLLVRRASSPAPGPASAQAGAARGGPGSQARAVPVSAAAVARRDVPVTLDGLGSVVAFRTVTVRPQVDGRLDQVLFKEGQAVRAGQVLAQIDPRPFEAALHQAEGARARDAAQLASGKLDLERYKALVKQNLVSQQQVDQQAGVVGQLEGAIRMDDAAIETAKLNLDYTRITSPVDGVTGIRIVDPGNVVHAADPGGIVLVTQLDPVAVLFTLPQDFLPAVVEAMQKGPLAVDAFARDGAPLGSGKLELVDNQINQATSTIRLKAVMPNPRHVLWPNQFVNARLHLSVNKGALVVPATAIQRGPNGTFVFVIGGDATVSPRAVEVASTTADVAVIGKGLEEGEKVVVDGQNQLRAGAKVQAREAGSPGGPGGQGGAQGPQAAPQAQGAGPAQGGAGSQGSPGAAGPGAQARDGGKGARE
jgi:multidrug efflux system membrane fusion protein